MKPTAYICPESSTSLKFSEAFAQGCGGTAIRSNKLLPGPVAFWGSPILWDLFCIARSQARTFWYGDHAYFGRKYYYRVTRNALQYIGHNDINPQRFEQFKIPIKPWRKTGNHILLCPPPDDFAELFGFNSHDWTQSMIQELNEHTDRKIIVREKKEALVKPILNDLQNAWCLVTYNSMVALDAIFAGIPAISTATWASATSCGSSHIHSIENPFMPEWRYEWACTLANNQWTLAEIKSGICWRQIGYDAHREGINYV